MRASVPSNIKSGMMTYLVCPDCHRPISGFMENFDPLYNGYLSCPNKHYYSVFKGVQVMIAPDRLSKILSTDEVDVLKRYQASDCFVELPSKCVSPDDEVLVQSYKNWSLQWSYYESEQKKSVWAQEDVF
jgi:uncharacterized protein YbaR (Trm112 family)